MFKNDTIGNIWFILTHCGDPQLETLVVEDWSKLEHWIASWLKTFLYWTDWALSILEDWLSSQKSNLWKIASTCLFSEKYNAGFLNNENGSVNYVDVFLTWYKKHPLIVKFVVSNSLLMLPLADANVVKVLFCREMMSYLFNKLFPLSTK